MSIKIPVITVEFVDGNDPQINKLQGMVNCNADQIGSIAMIHINDLARKNQIPVPDIVSFKLM